MAVRHIYTFINPISEKDIDAACAVLAADGVIAYPTDVNWAFGCDAASAKALDRIRQLKPTHPREQPFSLICDSIAMAASYANIDHAAYRILRKALPGAYTILLERNRSLPRAIKDNRRVVGIRIPDAPLVTELVKKFGRPLATTSVPNVTAFAADGIAEAPRFGYQVVEAFGHALDLVLDLGEEVPGLESTIIDFTLGAPQLVRQGAGDIDVFGDMSRVGVDEETST